MSRSMAAASALRSLRQPVDAVVQVLAEAPGVDLRAQPAVRCANELEIHRHRLAAAQRNDLPLLENSQQPRLHRERHVANLVEEQRAAVRLADAPRRAIAAGTGERTWTVAEQFGFDQRLGKRRAVDGNERPGASRTAAVAGTREQFLAHAGLALQQQRDGFVDHPAGTSNDGLHRAVAGVQCGQRVGRCWLGSGGHCRRAGRGDDGTAHVDADPKHTAVVPAQRARHASRPATSAQQRLQFDRKGPFDRDDADGGVWQAKQAERSGVGADDPTVLGQGQQTFGHGADTLRPRMQAQLEPAAVARFEQVVLDHACRRANQSQGVPVVAAVIARDVQHTEQLPRRVSDRRGCTGQERIALEVMLCAVHDDRGAVGERGADRIGASPLLVPDRSRPQRDACSLFREAGVTHRVQEHALRIREDDHAVGVADLSAKELHHRARIRNNDAAEFQRTRQLRARRMRRAPAYEHLASDRTRDYAASSHTAPGRAARWSIRLLPAVAGALRAVALGACGWRGPSQSCRCLLLSGRVQALRDRGCSR